MDEEEKHEAVILGVCAGIANTYKWDIHLVRILMLIFVLSTGMGFIIYLLLGLVYG